MTWVQWSTPDRQTDSRELWKLAGRTLASTPTPGQDWFAKSKALAFCRQGYTLGRDPISGQELFGPDPSFWS